MACSCTSLGGDYSLQEYGFTFTTNIDNQLFVFPRILYILRLNGIPFYREGTVQEGYSRGTGAAGEKNYTRNAFVKDLSLKSQFCLADSIFVNIFQNLHSEVLFLPTRF